MREMPKKILFIITMDDMGGAQTFLVNAVPVARGKGIDVVVGVGSEGSGDLSRRLRTRGCTTVIIPHLIRKTGLWNDLRALFEIWHLVRHERPDILFLLSSKAGFLGTLAGKMAGVSKIFYRIGGWAFLNPEFSTRTRFFFRLQEQAATLFRTIIFTNSQYEKDIAVELGVAPHSKLQILENSFMIQGHDFLSREEARHNLEERLGCNLDDTFLVGNFSRLVMQKNFKLFLETAHILHKKDTRYRFVIIGNGPEQKLLELECARLNLRGIVFMIPEISEAWRYLRALDVFLLTSISEGMPWVVIESFHAGVPVVAGNIRGLHEVITDGESGVLRPLDADELAHAVEGLRINATKREIIGQNAFRLAQERFGERAFLKVFDEIIR